MIQIPTKINVKTKHIINLCLVCFLFLSTTSSTWAQSSNKAKNQPFADQKLFHLGFMVGVHTQDLILSHSGFVNPDNSVWFAEIPSYSPGFSVGIIGDRYINQIMNLRVTPTLYFGQKSFTFREQDSSEEFKTSIRSNYLSLPIHMRFSAERLNNFRPYVLAGGYVSTEIGKPKNAVINYKKVDYGIEIGLGCNIYFPFFKLSPELKFSFGLRDLLDTKNIDVTDENLLRYPRALKSAKTRMISLVFNFE